MNTEEIKNLCSDLMEADTEKDVVGILEIAGYWDNPKVWRNYGDTEDNISTIGGQQSRAEYALVEKITNSIDATLINQCYLSGLDPKDERTPKTIREAVAR